MNAPRKPWIATGVLRLLFMDGFMMIILAVPCGIAFALLGRYGYDPDWHLALFVAAVMTGAMAIIGGIFLALGGLIAKRQIRALGYQQEENV